MKRKKILAILSVFVITLSFIFTSCSSLTSYPNGDSVSNSNNDYDKQIELLESQVLLLMQTQNLSKEEYQSKLEELQDEIDLLKEASKQEPTSTPNNESDKQEQEGSDSQKDETEEKDETQHLFTYTTDGKNAIITGYSGEDETLVIPKSIDGYVVTEIADSAISSSTIKDIIISESVTKIGWFAFSNCQKLKTVTIPSSVINIGYSAFGTSNRSLVIYCQGNSFAQAYAESYGLSYILL